MALATMSRDRVLPHRWALVALVALLPLAAAAASTDEPSDFSGMDLGGNVLVHKGHSHSGDGAMSGGVSVVCYPGQPLAIGKFW